MERVRPAKGLQTEGAMKANFLGFFSTSFSRRQGLKKQRTQKMPSGPDCAKIKGNSVKRTMKRQRSAWETRIKTILFQLNTIEKNPCVQIMTQRDK